VSFAVFTRTWWKESPDWPNGLEPEAGRKTYLERGLESEEDARALCHDWNRNHEAGRLSLKAEFEEE